MNIGIVGLGLIGGSLAKALIKTPNCTVLGWDNDPLTLQYAQMVHVLNGILQDANISQCDVLLVALYPQDTIKYLQEMAPYISTSTLVIDCCGTKREVCAAGFALAEKYGFTFVGGHPMAGTQYSGFKHSRADLFEGATMVIVPPSYDDIELFNRISELFKKIGFAKISITDAVQHDKMIAFTSQMPHIVSNAFIKSPTATLHEGFSAGSYQDLTRVAWLNPEMWTDLFLENRDNLLSELDFFIQSLRQYQKALVEEDRDALCQLLYEGKKRKEEVDG